MKNDYLWDRSGEPDPEIQQLENTLSKFRYQGEPPAFPQKTPVDKLGAPSFFRRPRFAILAAAAAVILVIASVAIVKSRLTPTPTARTPWDVARLSGAPRVGSHVLREDRKTAGLALGQSVETDGASRATITANAVGEIDVQPNTRVRLVVTGPGRQRLALDRGTIQAFIWAPAGEFVVDTPSARAIDLGCSYTLHVDDSGAGLLRTTMGWVGFKLADRESFIPAGAVCATRPKIGPGTPYFEGASDSFRAALAAFDFAAPTPEQRTAQLDVILAQARKQDALSLWHLLKRVDAAGRERVYDRLSALVPRPPGVTREGILGLNQGMLDAWWSQFGYGDVSLWRTFERSWSETEAPTK